MIISIKKSKYSDSLIILKQVEAGTAVRNICREHSISTVIFGFVA